MQYRFPIVDLFLSDQQVDPDMVYCIKKLITNDHKIIVEYSNSESEFQSIFFTYVQDKTPDLLQRIQFTCISQAPTPIAVYSFQHSLQLPNQLRRIEKPWGYEEIWSYTEFYVAKCIYIKPHHRLSLQYHQQKTESIYVLEGTLYLWQDAVTSPNVVLKNHFFHVPPHSIHRFGAKDESVLLLEVSTTELRDVVRIEDDFGRHNTP